MPWIRRKGLNLLTSQKIEYISSTDLSQNILARTSYAKAQLTVFGGEGIYSGGAVDETDLTDGGQSYPAVSMLIVDDDDEVFAFSTTLTTGITFNTTGGATSGDLYAVISLLSGLATDAAIAGPTDVEFIAVDEDATAPDNSFKLGTGDLDITPSFSSFTSISTTFKNWPDDLTWTLSGDVDSQTIGIGDVLYVLGGEGVTTENLGSNELEIALDLKSNDGLQISGGKLLLKLKSGGGLAIDSDGLYATGILEVDFNFDVDADEGETENISNDETFEILSDSPMRTYLNSNDEIEVSVLISDESGLQLVADQLGIKLHSTNHGLFLTTDGIGRTLAEFLLVGDTGTGTATENSSLRIIGSGSVVSEASATNTLKFKVDASSPIVYSGDGLTLTLYGDSFQTIISDEEGLFVNEKEWGDKYGHNDDSSRLVNGTTLRDRSGALWLYYYDNGIGDYAWIQKEVGSIRSGYLPVDDEFYGNSRLDGYRIRDLSFTDLVWRWEESTTYGGVEGYWISEEVITQVFKAGVSVSEANIDQDFAQDFYLHFPKIDWIDGFLISKIYGCTSNSTVVSISTSSGSIISAGTQTDNFELIDKLFLETTDYLICETSTSPSSFMIVAEFSYLRDPDYLLR